MAETTLEGNDLSRWRERLEAEKARLERQVAAMRRSVREDAEMGGVGELSLYDQHPADLGGELATRQTGLGLQHNLDRLLEQVNRALKRIEEGTYGICERCGRPIGKDRLEAAPHATMCLACQQQVERASAGRHARRPAEESVLNPPFGRTFLSDDYAAYDGEDTWRDLAQHGTSNTPSDEPG